MDLLANAFQFQPQNQFISHSISELSGSLIAVCLIDGCLILLMKFIIINF